MMLGSTSKNAPVINVGSRLAKSGLRCSGYRYGAGIAGEH